MKPRRIRRTAEDQVPYFKAEAPETFVALFNENMDWLRVRGYREGAIAVRKRVLGYFITWCEERGLLKPVEVTPPILERYQRYLFYYRKRDGKALTFASQVSLLTPLKTFFKWLAKKHYIPYNPASEIELPKRGRPLPKTIFTEHEIELIMSLPDVSTPLGIRDRAILEMFYATGIRRMEMANLKITDLDMELLTVTVRDGKCRKDRVVPMGRRAALWVEKYIYDARPLLETGLDEGALFLNNMGRAISPNGMTDQVGCYVKAAKLGKKGGCHLFRHTMATHMLENGADIRYVQEMLGHSQIETTQIYTRVSIRKLREVHSLTHPSERSLRESEKAALIGRETPSEATAVPTEWHSPENPPLAAIIAAFLAEKIGLLAGRTTEQMEYRLGRLLNWYGHLGIKTLPPDLETEYMNRRRGEGAVELSLKMEVRDINALFRFARDRGDIDNPPVFTSPDGPKNPRPRRTVSRAALETVLSFIDNPYFRLFLKFMRHMGLRKSEAMGMGHHWIDADRRLLRVESGERGIRILKIPQALLAEYLALPRISEWVFPSPQDPAIPMVQPLKTMQKACRFSRVGWFRFDDLRYSFSLDLAEKGVSGPVRGAILGLAATVEDEGKEDREKAMAEAMDLVE